MAPNPNPTAPDPMDRMRRSTRGTGSDRLEVSGLASAYSDRTKPNRTVSVAAFATTPTLLLVVVSIPLVERVGLDGSRFLPLHAFVRGRRRARGAGAERGVAQGGIRGHTRRVGGPSQNGRRRESRVDPVLSTFRRPPTSFRLLRW
jgi:hypothetical protein